MPNLLKVIKEDIVLKLVNKIFFPFRVVFLASLVMNKKKMNLKIQHGYFILLLFYYLTDSIFQAIN
jgi:hypothetical protein